MVHHRICTKTYEATFLPGTLDRVLASKVFFHGKYSNMKNSGKIICLPLKVVVCFFLMKRKQISRMKNITFKNIHTINKVKSVMTWWMIF